MLRSILETLFRWLVRNSVFIVLIPLYRWLAIRERFENGKKSLVLFPQTKNKKKVLALSAEEYRGDLEVLASLKGFRIFTIDRKWQTRLITCFYSRNLQGQPGIVARHYNANSISDPKIYEAKRFAQEFMSKFLGHLYRCLPIDVVLLYNVRYLRDLDWAEVSKKLGIVYLVIFREAMVLTSDTFESFSRRHREFGRFKGDHIVVSNLLLKRCFIEPGFANEKEVTVGGILRVDGLIKRLDEQKPEVPPPLVTMFWWSVHLFEGQEFTRLTTEAIEAFAELAMVNPGVNFIVKPKPIHVRPTKYINRKMKFRKGPSSFFQLKEFGNRQIDIEKILDRVYPEWMIVGNISIEPWLDAHYLIMKSRVICAFNSMTMFESALAKKPVIVPYFDYFRESINSSKYGYHEFLDIFDVARTKHELKTLIEWRLSDNVIEPTVQERREALFSSHVSDLSSGSSAARVGALITDLVKKNI